MARKPQYDWRWQKTRLEILDRDDHTCQIRGPLCTRRATQVDHIVPLNLGGARLDPANLRAACQPCNGHLSQKARRPTATASRDW